MADVQWIKIKTDMFDNRKIKHLRKLPEGNNIVLIWVMLLTMAGRCNASGMIFLTENIPYTAKLLADELDFEENTVLLALEALERYGMIDRDNKFLCIPGWEEYQNAEALDKIREQTRKRVAKYREKQKLLTSNVTCNVTGHYSNAIEEDIEKDIEEDIEKEYIASSGEEDCSPANAEAATTSKKAKKDKPVKHKHGEYNNVLLTDVELDKLKAKFADWEERIDRLSGYIESKGARYKSHYATILNWSRREQEQAGNRGQWNRPAPKNTGHPAGDDMTDLDDLF